MSRASGLIVLLATVVAWTIVPTPDTERGFIPIKAMEAPLQGMVAEETSTVSVPIIENQFISDTTDKYVHAASVTELQDGRLLAVWVSGTREGAGDVVIAGANYNPNSQLWEDNFNLVTLASARADLGRFTRKLGNPVVTTLPNGRIMLFYVSVSIGGWAGSSINVTYSDDQGMSWSRSQKIITSPLFNISTLVKGNPILFADGSIGLPVYHEFIGKFGELLHIDNEGRLLEKIRLNYGKHSLQPVIIPRKSDEATVLMRHAVKKGEGRVLLTQIDNAGNVWEPVRKTDIPNPNSAVTGIRIDDGSILAVVNDLDVYRHRLSLYRSTDEGENWTKLHSFDASHEADPEPGAGECSKGHHRSCVNPLGLPIFEPSYFAKLLESDFLASAGEKRVHLLDDYLTKIDKRHCKKYWCRFKYDYPYIIRSSDGNFHLLYSWNKSFIKHVSFNQAWLETLI